MKISDIHHVMKNHIGEDNKVTRYILFEEMFGRVYKPGDLRDITDMDALKRNIRLVRCNTNCFVINDKKGYYVMSNGDEQLVYKNQIEKMGRSLERMNEQCERALNEQWHLQEWENLKLNQKDK
jgi:hypothetical protein